MGDNEKTWTTLDEDLGDGVKFWSLEYVEVLCVGHRGKEVPPWWENDTGSSKDGRSDSGRESDGEDWETKCREECNSPAIESLRGEKGKQREGIPLGVESGSNASGALPDNVRATMDNVADFHRRQKPLTDVFPHLSMRGVLWCAMHGGILFPPPLRSGSLDC